MAETIRVDSVTYDRLKKLSKDEGTTLQEQLRRAVAFFEQKRFFETLKAQLAARTPEEIAEDRAEVELWDRTRGDGLHSEGAYADSRIR